LPTASGNCATSLHDPVCGLPNRIYFSERLERAIAEVRNGGPTAAVFYIDLDHFKDVNDTLGHHIGDELILNVTRRLSEIIRGDDLVARLGGDEFAIIMICAADNYSLQAVAERILAAICTPFVVSGHGINIGASIGIAVIDSCTQNARCGVFRSTSSRSIRVSCARSRRRPMPRPSFMPSSASVAASA